MIGSILGCYFTYLAGLKASQSLHSKLLNNVIRLPISFFNTTPIGRLLNRFSDDIRCIDIDLPKQIKDLPAEVVDILIALCYCTYVTPILLLPIFPCISAFIYIQRYNIKCSRQLRKLFQVAKSPIYSNYSESLAGPSSIRAFNKQEYYIQKNEYYRDVWETRHMSLYLDHHWLRVRLSFIQQFLISAQALFTVMAKGKLSSSDVGLAMYYGRLFINTFEDLINKVTNLENQVVAVERVEEYCNLPTEGALYQENLRKSWPNLGKIDFKNYSSKYYKSENLALNNINLTINQGEKVGIVGRTGAGKSSLTLSLFRLLEAIEGQIIIDGMDIKKVGLAQLRSRLTIIPQDPLLFSGSLRYNLDPTAESTDNKTKHADEYLCSVLKAVNINDQNFISNSSQKGTDILNFQIKENGENISVGQRQLICLARALVRKSKILILDEATASVDPMTDKILQETIREQFMDCTVLTIAHRIETILDYDRVMVLDRGEVVEFDEPDKLLDDKSSLFYSLCEKR